MLLTEHLFGHRVVYTFCSNERVLDGDYAAVGPVIEEVDDGGGGGGLIHMEARQARQPRREVHNVHSVH